MELSQLRRFNGRTRWGFAKNAPPPWLRTGFGSSSESLAPTGFSLDTEHCLLLFVTACFIIGFIIPANRKNVKSFWENFFLKLSILTEKKIW